MTKARGQQVRATNVVVLWAQHKAASSDKVGSTTYDIVLTGSGRATVFRDGQNYDCTWEAGPDAPPVFKASRRDAGETLSRQHLDAGHQDRHQHRHAVGARRPAVVRAGGRG